MNSEGPFGKICELQLNDKKEKYFEISKGKNFQLSYFNYILMRKDPPIDNNYIYMTYMLDTLDNKITKIINPTGSYPGDGTLDAATTGQRYLLTSEISGSQWGISADVNDIIEYNGSAWTKVFDASAITTIHYVTNTYTGKQFKWENETWTSSHEGTYNPGFWRINI